MGICQTLHVIHWTEEACFRPRRTNLVEVTDCFLSSAHRWSLIMTHNPLRLSPTAFPVESRLHKFFLLPSQRVRAHRDWGRVIVTVPALGCPRVSRWDLTRHGLSSLPYSPYTGGRVGEGATRGEEIIGCEFSFVSSKHLCSALAPIDPSKQFCSTAQFILTHFLKKQFTMNCVGLLLNSLKR